MRVLAIESATAACSVALFDDGVLADHFHAVLGRGHAEHLVPAIAALPAKGRADRILVSLGPGSFTGVRIGLAAARALGLAWGAEVLGYPTLALVAAMAREQGASAVTVCMTGGHGEWFVAGFDADGVPQGAVKSLAPVEAARETVHPAIAGDRAADLAALLDGDRHVVPLLPDARLAIRLPSRLLTTDLSPIYGRGPDAALPGEARKRV